MKTEWDYTDLADAYLERPDYADEALDKIVSITGLLEGDRVCDIGAGVAHLTIPLAERGFAVDAVEPNDAMRANGQKRTAHMPAVTWSEGTGEVTGRPDGAYDFVSFGSSFNVCDRRMALQETYRLLKPKKWFCCLWNHRNLEDPFQKEIERIIKTYIPDYGYGTRREDQSATISTSKLFTDVQEVTGQVSHTQSVEKTIEAWRSHATLHRQAGECFPNILREIAAFLRKKSASSIKIPYTTQAWVARRKD